MIKCLSKVANKRLLLTSFYRFSQRENNQKQSLEVQQVTNQLVVPLIRTKQSIIINQTTIKYPQLTSADKKQLKLYIPQSTFNHRLTVVDQQSYLQTITSELYDLQARQLKPQIKILQSQTNSNINKYLNIIYKDIYARYLVSKGIGIDWEGRYPHLGVMNSNIQQENSNPYWLFIEALERGDLYVSKVPTLVSIDTLMEYNIDHCHSQIIKRIGHYVKFPLVSFGKYQEQFQAIKNKGGKIQMIGLTSELWKSTQAQGISLIQKLKYTILRKGETDNYIITSCDHYDANKTYFSKNYYTKHSTVDSIHFEGMFAENPFGKKIPVVFQQYKRGTGNQIYPLCPAHTLSDNQTAIALGLEVTSTVTQQGILKIGQSNIAINDKTLESKIIEFLKQNNRIVQNLNDVLEDTLLTSADKQILYILPLQKLFIKVGQQDKIQLLHDLQNYCSIEQSKVTLPRPDPNVSLKGRIRRQFMKGFQAVKQQQTDYYSLSQSLKLQQISISSNRDKSYPIMVNTKKNKVVISQNNLNKLKKLNQQNQINIQQFQEIKQPFSQQRIFYLNDNFIKTARILTLKNKQSRPVAIEPQSQTQGLLQYYLHLIASLRLPFKLAMIKLHPTLKQTVENLAIETLIAGATKSNDMRQYGWGFEAVRAWVAKMDSHKGDRDISQQTINKQQPHCASLRKTFWKILSFFNKVSPQRLSQIKQSTPSLPWFDQFMIDHIDFYILHMQNAYKRLDLSAAYELTMQFFQKYIEQIYVQSVRKSLINYYRQDSKLIVFERILHLVGVISPILPFTAYHISKIQLQHWPRLQQMPNYHKIQQYNFLISLRTRLRNKLSLNRIENCTIYLQGEVSSSIQSDQLALFFNVNQVVYLQPNRKQRFTLTEGKYIIKAYDYETCYRCDPKLGKQEHLCRLCQNYVLEQ